MSRILLDENVPFGLRRLLTGHVVTHVTELRWDGLSNGRLLAAAKEARYDTFLTADRNLPYQQSWEGRRLALVILSTSRWRQVQSAVPMIQDALQHAEPGSLRFVQQPDA